MTPAMSTRGASRARFARPTPAAHPNRLLAAAALHGFAPPARAALTLLELGCGSGVNLIPIAAAYPGGRFVGVDPSAERLAQAAAMAAGAGVSNVTFVNALPEALPADLGRFDVVLACGQYSRAAPDARDALMRALALTLAPRAVAYLDFDALPGGWLRRIGSDAMQFHARGAIDPDVRAAKGNEMLSLLIEAWAEQPGTGSGLAACFADPDGSASEVFPHDASATEAESFYLSTVANHARRHGLALVGDAEPGAGALAEPGDAARARAASRPPASREQMLDFFRLRTRRQALIVHASEQPAPTAGAADLHFAAPLIPPERRNTESPRADAVLNLLAAARPGSVSSQTLIDALRASGIETANVVRRVRDAWLKGQVQPYVDALAIAARPADRPRASPVARWQATREPRVTTLRHEATVPSDECARQVLARCDGIRNVEAIASEVRPWIPADEAAAPEAAVLRRLDAFAHAALLEA